MMFIGASSLNASEMKCGAGKCGAAMNSSAPALKNINGCNCKAESCKHTQCAAKKDPSKACDCKMGAKMKCEAGQCGSAMKSCPTPQKNMNGCKCKAESCNHKQCAAKQDPSKACDCKMGAKMKCGTK